MYIKIIQTHIVPAITQNIRFKEYVVGKFDNLLSKQGIKKAIKRGLLIIDGEQVESGRWVKTGQKIELLENEQAKPKPYAMPLSIVYEDDYILVINKPSGLVSSGNQFKTAENAAINCSKISKASDRLSWAKPAHRLDASTSGLLLFAKTTKAQVELYRQFEKKLIRKQYLAIVNGKINKVGVIDSPIEGKPALTNYLRIKCVESLQNQWLSFIELNPETGRTHQLRIHLANIGHPIVGDKIYGTKGDILKNKGLFLCATQLHFLHPVTKKAIDISILEPPKFKALLNREKRRWKKYNAN